MHREEIFTELSLSYDELVHYLLNKYGGAVSDYFATPECNSHSKKISRTSEGLYCHHIDEDKGGNLSSPMGAKNQPYAWQKKERLVYCNILEHLLLHIKIAVLRQKKRFYKPAEIDSFFTTGGIYEICKDINDMYSQDGSNTKWVQRCYAEIKDNYADYILLLKTIITYLQKQYYGEKSDSALLKKGSRAKFSDGSCAITGVCFFPEKVRLQTERHDVPPLYGCGGKSLSQCPRHSQRGGQSGREKRNRYRYRFV